MPDHSVSSIGLDVEEMLGWGWGHTCRGFSVTYKDVTVLLVIKATDQRGKFLVAFIETYSLLDCFIYLSEAATKTSAPLKWRADRYAK